MKKFFSIILTIIFICLFFCSGCKSEESKKLQVKIFCNYTSSTCSGAIPYSGKYGNISDLINSIDNIVDVKIDRAVKTDTYAKEHIHYLVLYEENV